MSEEEGGDKEEEATPRRGRPRRSSLGLRVALQFPKKPAKTTTKHAPEPLFPSACSQDSTKAILRRKKSCRPGKERDDSASEPEEDSRDEEGQESSDPLLKRTMNIKENKAMVRPPLGAGQAPTLHPASSALASLRTCAPGTVHPFLSS